jgi:hypothetical protein
VREVLQQDLRRAGEVSCRYAKATGRDSSIAPGFFSHEINPWMEFPTPRRTCDREIDLMDAMDGMDFGFAPLSFLSIQSMKPS